MAALRSRPLMRRPWRRQGPRLRRSVADRSACLVRRPCANPCADAPVGERPLRTAKATAAATDSRLRARAEQSRSLLHGVKRIGGGALTSRFHRALQRAAPSRRGWDSAWQELAGALWPGPSHGTAIGGAGRLVVHRSSPLFGPHHGVGKRGVARRSDATCVVVFMAPYAQRGGRHRPPLLCGGCAVSRDSVVHVLRR